MPIAKITGPGLAGIGISVALLWGCVIGERVMVARAFTERTRVIQDVERMRRRQAEPVSAPSIQRSHPVRVTAG
jgi:hypothetical protein